MVKLGWNGGNIASRSCQDNRPSGQFRIPGRQWRYNPVIGQAGSSKLTCTAIRLLRSCLPVVEDDPTVASLDFRKVPIAELIKEERYIFSIGTEEHVLRVQELVSGSTPWPEPFRTHLPASNFREARKFHGRTALAVADRATKYISSTVREVPPSPRRSNSGN